MSDVDSKMSRSTERIIEESKAGEKMKELARKKVYYCKDADRVDRMSIMRHLEDKKGLCINLQSIPYCSNQGLQ